MALLLKRHAIPNVCVTLSCSDRPVVPKRSVRRRQPPLILSYMTSRDHFDVPWPDYLFWGRPASQAAAWSTVHKAVLNEAGRLPFHQRLRRTLYASKPLTQDLNYYKMYQPLRRAYTLSCLYNCSAPSDLDVEGDVPQVLSRLRQLSQDEAHHSYQYRYKCWYDSLLLMNGRSAWLDHFKADLAHGLRCDPS